MAKKYENVEKILGLLDDEQLGGLQKRLSSTERSLSDILKKLSALENIQKGLAENNEAENQGLLFNEIVAYEYKREFTTAKQKMQAYLKEYPEDAEALRENEFLSTR